MKYLLILLAVVIVSVAGFFWYKENLITLVMNMANEPLDREKLRRYSVSQLKDVLNGRLR